MKSDRTMHIISCTDNNYAQHLSVMFTSLLMNMDKQRDVKLYVIDGGIEEDHKERLKKTTDRFGVPVTFLDVEKANMTGPLRAAILQKRLITEFRFPISSRMNL